MGPERISFRKFGACLKLGTTKPTGAMVCALQNNHHSPALKEDISECYTSKCIPDLHSTNVTCASYCYHPNITTKSGCDNYTSGSTSYAPYSKSYFFLDFTREWATWNDVVTGIAQPGACLVYVPDYTSCIDLNLEWFTGMKKKKSAWCNLSRSRMVAKSLQ